MNIGMIGFGKMGKIRFKELTKLQNINVISIHDPFVEDIPRQIENSDPDDIIFNKKIDSIFIATVTSLNAHFTIKSLENGKNVFCEKPPAVSAGELKKVIEAEKKSGKFVYYGFNHRNHESIMKIKEAIDSNEYGRILWMRGRYGKSVDEKFFDEWRSKKDLAGGGILLDQGIHMIDLFNSFGGDFDLVQSHASNLYWNIPGIEDNVFAILSDSKSGMVASLHSTMTQWRHLFSLEVFMERGSIVLNGLKTSSGTYGKERLSIAKNRSVAPAATWEEEKIFEYDTNSSWSIEIRKFLEMCEKGVGKVRPSHEALNVMKIIDKIYAEGIHQPPVERHNKLV